MKNVIFTLICACFLNACSGDVMWNLPATPGGASDAATTDTTDTTQRLAVGDTVYCRVTNPDGLTYTVKHLEVMTVKPDDYALIQVRPIGQTGSGVWLPPSNCTPYRQFEIGDWVTCQVGDTTWDGAQVIKVDFMDPSRILIGFNDNQTTWANTTSCQ